MCVPGATLCHSWVVHTVHSAHSRSWCAPAALVSHCSSPHVVSGKHKRSLVAVANVDSYSVASSHTVYVWHSRSCVCRSMPTTFSHCSPVMHCECERQTRSELAVGFATSYWSLLQRVIGLQFLAPVPSCHCMPGKHGRHISAPVPATAPMPSDTVPGSQSRH